MFEQSYYFDSGFVLDSFAILDSSRPVARIYDVGSHGGVIVTGSFTTQTDARKTARDGDIYACPLHGPNPVIATSVSTQVDGRRIARLGDPTSCGAVIVTGSFTTKSD